MPGRPPLLRVVPPEPEAVRAPGDDEGPRDDRPRQERTQDERRVPTVRVRAGGQRPDAPDWADVLLGGAPARATGERPGE